MLKRRIQFGIFGLIMVITLLPSCSSLTWTGTHAGIRYSIHRDKRTHAIVKGKDGSLMYDSPELIVNCEMGKLIINGEECGAISEGDLVEVTELGTVLVNGQRRGDKMTGNEQMQSRIRQAKAIMETHTDTELTYKAERGL